MPQRPKRLRQNPRKSRFLDEASESEPEDEEHALTNNTENKHPNNQKNIRKRQMDQSKDSMDILAVSKLATEGWAARWQALMEEHDLPTSNALAEMLINA